MRPPYRVSSRFAALLLLLTAAVPGQAALAAEPLPALGADLSRTSVSGLSSGGFMTAQFHVAYSDTLVGAGIIAGGPFYCSGSFEGSSFLTNATTNCMNPLGFGPDPKILLAKAKEFEREGKIDSLSNLKDDRVYLFSGVADTTVTTKVVDQDQVFYTLAGVPEENIKYVKSVDAGHAIITDRSGDASCPITSPPFINDCAFMQSHEILKHIYGALKPPASTLSGRLVAFDQSEFINSDRSSMSQVAYLYIPKSCEEQACNVHVVFHGCEQGAAVIGDKYYSTTGYNELADSNAMIVLYPQAEPSDPVPYNPKGCWDFWGYSSPDHANPNFYSKDAPQMLAVMGMLQRLAEPRP